MWTTALFGANIEFFEIYDVRKTKGRG